MGYDDVVVALWTEDGAMPLVIGAQFNRWRQH